ncbi:MAG: methyltransferase domain-containing protein [Pseudomonadota bacterium]
MSPSSPPELFNRARIAHNRDRASQSFEDYAFLKTRESTQLLERLKDSPRKFSRGLDLWAHSGQTSDVLRASGLVDCVTALEPSPMMRKRLSEKGFGTCGFDEERLAFDDQVFDLVVSVLGLHWVNDLPGLLHQIRRVLKPDGLFLAALFGGETLHELRQCLIEAESEFTGGVSPRLSPLPKLQDMAGLLQRAGFALPVADIDRVTVRYGHPMKLLHDLKGMGEQAAFAGQGRRPLSRRILARMSDLYLKRFSDPDGKVRASFDVIWVSGWAPAANQPKPLKPGSGKFSLEAAVKQARQDE